MRAFCQRFPSPWVASTPPWWRRECVFGWCVGVRVDGCGVIDWLGVMLWAWAGLGRLQRSCLLSLPDPLSSCAADDVRFPFGVEPVPCRPESLPKPVTGVNDTLSREARRPQLGAGGEAARNRRILRELSNYHKNPHEYAPIAVAGGAPLPHERRRN
jgi:hypothetical protein